jgi:hypothetical protein
MTNSETRCGCSCSIASTSAFSWSCGFCQRGQVGEAGSTGVGPMIVRDEITNSTTTTVLHLSESTNTTSSLEFTRVYVYRCRAVSASISYITETKSQPSLQHQAHHLPALGSHESHYHWLYRSCRRCRYANQSSKANSTDNIEPLTTRSHVQTSHRSLR